MIPKNLKSERIYEKFLKSSGIKYVHHPKRFQLKNSKYTPDFYLPDLDTYIEVKGSLSDFIVSKKKIYEFKALYPHIKFKIVDLEGKDFDETNNRNNKCLPTKSWRHMVDLDEKTHKTVKELAAKEGCWLTTLVRKAVILYKKTVHKK